MFSLGKVFQYKGKPVKLSTHEFITLLKIRMSSPGGASGYKVISDLGKMFAGSWSPQTGTVYPILRRLVEIKNLIIEKEEKTPIGPATKVYKVNPDLEAVLDNVVLDNYKHDLQFFTNYIEFLVENLEHSLASRVVDMTASIDMQADLGETIKKLQAVHDKLGKMEETRTNRVSCKGCGAVMDRVARFCPQCGESVQEQ